MIKAMLYIQMTYSLDLFFKNPPPLRSITENNIRLGYTFCSAVKSGIPAIGHKCDDACCKCCYLSNK